jgi:hypothetical protein
MKGEFAHRRGRSLITHLGATTALIIVVAATSNAQVTDEGPLPRHDVENEHVPGLLDHSNFTFIGRSNPQGPYIESARNWTDLYGYVYDGTNPEFFGRRYAYVSTGGYDRRGNFQATHKGGVAIFDVTEAVNPEWLGTFLPECTNPSGTCSFLVRDIEIHDGVAYFSSERTSSYTGGVFVVDLRPDPTQPTELAHINGADFNALNPVHEIGLDVVGPKEAYLYTNNSQTPGIVNVFDISDPRTSIAKVAEITGIGTHGVYADNGVLYVAGDTTVSVYDVSDVKNGNVPMLGQFIAPGGFTHGSWPDQYTNGAGEVRNVLYVAHEASGTDMQVWDVTDVLNGTNPSGAYQIAAVTNLDLELTQGTGHVTNVHNLFLVGDLLFTSWTAAGMVVLDVSDPENPRIIDTFDTNIVEGNSNFAGDFGVNPAIGFDRVLISDRSTGLWVVDVSAIVPEPAGSVLLIGILAALVFRRGRT